MYLDLADKLADGRLTIDDIRASRDVLPAAEWQRFADWQTAVARDGEASDISAMFRRACFEVEHAVARDDDALFGTISRIERCSFERIESFRRSRDGAWCGNPCSYRRDGAFQIGGGHMCLTGVTASIKRPLVPE